MSKGYPRVKALTRGKYSSCGETKPLSEVDDLHVQRHADGGPTTKENGSAPCKECHKEVHAKEK